jgi:hypothetical protein
MGPTAQPAPSKKRRRWWAFSVRTMLLVVLLIGLPLGWWTRKAQLQRASARRIDALDAAVVYDFEELDEGRATTAAEHRIFLARLGAGATVQVDRPAPPKARPAQAIARYQKNLARLHGLKTDTAPAPTPATAPTPEPESTDAPSSKTWREWARDQLGVDYSDSVTRVIAEHSRKIRDDDLAMLLDFPKLELLNLGETSIGDAGLAYVASLHRIKTLHLDTTKVTDAGLAHLGRLDRLETLSLGDNGDAITDAGLARLGPLGSLQVLEIGGPKITDAGLDQLRALKNLKKLHLIEAPSVTDEGLARLRAALPKLEILQYKRRRGGRTSDRLPTAPGSSRRPSPGDSRQSPWDR